MATKIRLKRIGRRNRPFYRLVIMDARNRRDGAAIEEVGWYNPTAKDEMYSLKEDRILHWLEEGAQPTDTAHDILRTAGLAHKWHLLKQGLDETAVEKEMKKWALEREDVLERRRQRAEAKVAEKKAAAGKKAAATAAEVDKPAEPDAKTEPPAETAPTDKAPGGTADKSADEKEEPKEEDVKDDAGADESEEDSAAKDEDVEEDKSTEEEAADESADEKEEPKEEDVKDDAGADESEEDSAAEVDKPAEPDAKTEPPAEETAPTDRARVGTGDSGAEEVEEPMVDVV